MPWKQILWMVLAAVLAASNAGCLVLLAACRRTMHQARRTDGREVYVEYENPVYPGRNGFALNNLPDTDTLTPTRYWLVDDGIAEVEFSVEHSGRCDAAGSPDRQSGFAGAVPWPGI